MNLWSFFMGKIKKNNKGKEKEEKPQTYKQDRDVDYVTGTDRSEPEEDEADLPDDIKSEKKEAK